jgi:tetratricopeptide (TPR) repeat protein
LEALATALSLAPHDLETPLARARALSALGRPAESVACYDRYLSGHPIDASVWSERALDLCASGQREKAIASAARAVELAPETGRYWLNYGIVLDAAGSTGEALTSYQRALELSPNGLRAWHQLGHLYLREFLSALKQSNLPLAQRHWVEGVRCGRQGQAPEWNHLEFDFLQGAVVLGQGEFVLKLLLELEDGNPQLPPLQCAVEVMIAGNKAILKRLPRDLRRHTEALIQRLSPLAA